MSTEMAYDEIVACVEEFLLSEPEGPMSRKVVEAARAFQDEAVRFSDSGLYQGNQSMSNLSTDTEWATEVTAYAKSLNAPKTAAADHAIGRLLQNFSPAPEAFGIGGLTDAGISRARGILGEVELKNLAMADAFRVQHTRPIMRDAFRESHFVRSLAEPGAVEAAALSVVADGLPLDLAEVDRRAGKSLVGLWLGFQKASPRPADVILADLASRGQKWVSDMANRLAAIDVELSELDASIATVGLPVYCEKFSSLSSEQKRISRTYAGAVASLKALPVALGKGLAEALKLAGGPEELAVAIREARMAQGTWPGTNPELSAAETALAEAAGRMRLYKPINPETPEGPLYEGARHDRDGLIPIVEGLRVETERAAVDAIRSEVKAVITGDPAAYGRLMAIVDATPAAFPEPVRLAFEAAARTAIVEGAWGISKIL